MPGRHINRLSSCLNRHTRFPLSHWRASSTLGPTSDALGLLRQDEEAHHSYRILKNGDELPVPPLLDPLVRSERSRWQSPKPEPRLENFTSFQKKLLENPFAHALASPPRECRATFTILPSALLLTLHPRPHPTTNAPWLLPVSLTTSTKHLGPPYRFLGHQYIATYLSKKRNWEKGLYSRVTQKLGRTACDNLVWREDMASLILNLLRDRLLSKLQWFFGFRGRLIPVRSPLREDIDGVEDVSSILYLDSLKTHADELQSQVEQLTIEGDKWSSYFSKQYSRLVDPHEAPGVTHSSPLWYVEAIVPRLAPRVRFPVLEFKTTTWRGRKVPVYSLLDMLGEEKLEKLVKGSKYEGDRCLVLKSRRHSVPVGMQLAQLQMYLVQSAP